MASGMLGMLNSLMDTNTTLSGAAVSVESAHTTSHKSASMRRTELISPGERRRRWTTEQKQMIAAESLAPGASPTAVARLHGIGTGQLYLWRRALKAAQPAASPPLTPRFARVDVAPRPAVPPAVPARLPGLIEIGLSDGTTLRVDAEIDPSALRRVLAALRGPAVTEAKRLPLRAGR
jgi:transposase